MGVRSGPMSSIGSIEGLAHERVPDPVDVRLGEPGVVLAGDVRGGQRPPLGDRQGFGQDRLRISTSSWTEKNRGATGICLVGLSLSGIDVAARPLEHDGEDGELARGRLRRPVFGRTPAKNAANS